MKKIFLFGDSHVGAIKKGYDESVKENPELSRSFSVKPLGGGGTLTSPFSFEHLGEIFLNKSEHKKNIKKFPVDNFDVYGFSAPLHSTRVWRDIDWSRHAPSRLAEQESPVSSSLLNEIFWSDQKYILRFIDSFISLNLTIFVIEGPRPFKHHSVFKKRGYREEVVSYIDSEYRKFVFNELDRRGVSVVRVPDYCFCENGFMLEEFKSYKKGDGHHANEVYGEIIFNEIVRFVNSRYK